MRLIQATIKLARAHMQNKWDKCHNNCIFHASALKQTLARMIAQTEHFLFFLELLLEVWFGHIIE